LFVREQKYQYEQLVVRSRLFSRNLYCSRYTILPIDHTRISNGKNCSIGNFTIIDICDNGNSGKKSGKLTLGDFVYVGEQCNLRASGSEVKIGNNTMIANNVVMISVNHKTQADTLMRLQDWETDRCGIVIGQDCWIGSHSTILPGTIIGDGCVIAAGAVVRGEIPAMTIWGGVPAKFLKNRTD